MKVNVSAKYISSVFRVKYWAEKESSLKQAAIKAEKMQEIEKLGNKLFDVRYGAEFFLSVQFHSCK
jgi:hypothetical protein